MVNSLADFIPVLPHVFPVDRSWYIALNLIARHAITAAEVVTDITTPCRGFQPFSGLLMQCGCHRSPRSRKKALGCSFHLCVMTRYNCRSFVKLFSYNIFIWHYTIQLQSWETRTWCCDCVKVLLFSFIVVFILILGLSANEIQRLARF